MKTETRITGLGGQGAITAGHILGRAAVLYENLDAIVTEGYSPYVTGGWSRADVIISDEKIDFPFISKLDSLVAMYQEGLDQNLKLLKNSAVAIVENRLVDASKIKERSVISLPASNLASKLGKKLLTNVILLGSLAALMEHGVSLESLKKSVAQSFPKAVDLNHRALDAGFEMAKTGKLPEELIANDSGRSV